MEVVYQTYKEELPEYMAGYTGHIPTVQKEEFVNQIVHTKHIPGYMGFAPQLNPKINTVKVTEKKLLKV